MNRATTLHIIKDAITILLGLGLAVVLAVTPYVEQVLTASIEIELIASFVSGLFFTSVATTAPAVVILARMGSENSPWLIAFVGALGAVLGDLILFRLVQSHVNKDIEAFLKTRRWRSVFSFSRFRSFTWLLPFIGGLIIASPLPDELGVTLLGVTKLPNRLFIVVSYLSNFTGILLVTLIGKSLS